MVLDKDIYTQTKSGIDMGTVYYVNKDYEIVDDKRIFNRIPTLLVSGYTAIDESNNVWIDTLDNCPNIVTFI
jgi:CRISPR-associated protein Cas5t